MFLQEQRETIFMVNYLFSCHILTLLLFVFVIFFLKISLVLVCFLSMQHAEFRRQNRNMHLSVTGEPALINILL